MFKWIYMYMKMDECCINVGKMDECCMNIGKMDENHTTSDASMKIV